MSTASHIPSDLVSLALQKMVASDSVSLLREYGQDLLAHALYHGVEAKPKVS